MRQRYDPKNEADWNIGRVGPRESSSYGYSIGSAAGKLGAQPGAAGHGCRRHGRQLGPLGEEVHRSETSDASAFPSRGILANANILRLARQGAQDLRMPRNRHTGLRLGRLGRLMRLTRLLRMARLLCLGYPGLRTRASALFLSQENGAGALDLGEGQQRTLSIQSAAEDRPVSLHINLR